MIKVNCTLFSNGKNMIILSIVIIFISILFFRDDIAWFLMASVILTLIGVACIAVSWHKGKKLSRLKNEGMTYPLTITALKFSKLRSLLQFTANTSDMKLRNAPVYFIGFFCDTEGNTHEVKSNLFNFACSERKIFSDFFNFPLTQFDDNIGTEKDIVKRAFKYRGFEYKAYVYVNALLPTTDYAIEVFEGKI